MATAASAASIVTWSGSAMLSGLSAVTASISACVKKAFAGSPQPFDMKAMTGRPSPAGGGVGGTVPPLRTGMTTPLASVQPLSVEAALTMRLASSAPNADPPSVVG